MTMCFSFFIGTGPWQHQRWGGEVILVPHRHWHVSFYQPWLFKWQYALFSFFIVTRWRQQGGEGKVVLVPRHPWHALYYRPQRCQWQHAFLFFIATCWQQWRQGGKVVLVPCRPWHASYYLLWRGQWKGSFIFYCCPLTTTTTRRQGYPHIPPPPTRAYDSVTFYFNLDPRRFQWPCAVHFLLVPDHDNNNNEEARLSVYRATANACCIIGCRAANENVPFLFISTCSHNGNKEAMLSS